MYLISIINFNSLLYARSSIISKTHRHCLQKSMCSSFKFCFRNSSKSINFFVITIEDINPSKSTWSNHFHYFRNHLFTKVYLLCQFRMFHINLLHFICMIIISHNFPTFTIYCIYICHQKSANFNIKNLFISFYLAIFYYSTI